MPNRRLPAGKRMRSRALAGAVVLAGACVASSPGHRSGESYAVAVPLGLDIAAPVPADNPLSEGRIELGRALFFDSLLSVDGTLSCAACHRPDRYFTDGRERAVGVGGREGPRNVPSVLNVAYGRAFFWDGRAGTLEDQVLEPIRGEGELALDLDEMVRRLASTEHYRSGFRDAFGDGAITTERVARALASYLRTLRSGDAPIDRFLYGDSSALSPDARRGFRLFVGRANCGVCHTIPLFTDHDFHNTGVSWGSGDIGRAGVTGDEADRGAFKTPSLRNVAETAPYMHDGSVATLEEVVDHYDRGGTPNPRLDEEIQPLGLSAVEKRQLVAFLRALTSGSGAR